MKITDNAQKVLEKRYFAEGENWEKLCERVALKVSSDEKDKQNRAKWLDNYFQLMYNLYFLPNSPTLRNFGRNNGCGSACFVLPIEDSRRSIFKTLSDAVDVQAYGGGTGMSFSNLRPKGDKINTTGGKASGPVSFMGIFDYTIGDIIKQGGTRHGANMGILRVDHPDIERFIDAKKEEGVLKNFNLSVGITNEFMKAVENDASFNLVFNGRIYNQIKALRVWDKIIEGAWGNGEPGIVFLDTINHLNPLSPVGKIEATNPCGEQPLLPFSSCNLGSINLSQMIKGQWVEQKADIDWELLKRTVQHAVRFLDSVISVNSYPISEIEKMTLLTRQIGLGIMGFADICIKLYISYGSKKSLELAKQVMQFIYNEALETSIALGEEKGVAPAYESYTFNCKPKRNGALTTIAPTGTLSVIADCSSGCEPHFAFNYTKECLEGEKLSMLPKVMREWYQHNGHQPLPSYFVSSNDISVKEHIQIQSAFQKNGIDAAVSKTINAPNETTKEDVSDAFIMAWKHGCKGITFYRDGSRDVQALYTAETEKKYSQNGNLARGELKKRPRATTGPSMKMQTACGRLYVDSHFDKDGPIEVFIATQGGGCAANTKALGILLSYCLRSGIPPRRIIRSMQAIHCRACTRGRMAGRKVEVNSCAAGMGKALEVAIENGDLFCEAAQRTEDADSFFNGWDQRKPEKKKLRCPDCKSEVHKAEGCVICSNMECGWSRC
jgi:ribonucleoside-diphosphate reductase alpha chain